MCEGRGGQTKRARSLTAINNGNYARSPLLFHANRQAFE